MSPIHVSVIYQIRLILWIADPYRESAIAWDKVAHSLINKTCSYGTASNEIHMLLVVYLLPANKVWGKVVFLQLPVILHGGVCI